MTSDNFIDYARSFGYSIEFTGIGMAYIKFEDIKLTETMDTSKAYVHLAQIGMAIMIDTMRNETY